MSEKIARETVVLPFLEASQCPAVLYNDIIDIRVGAFVGLVRNALFELYIFVPRNEKCEGQVSRDKVQQLRCGSRVRQTPTALWS